MIKEKPKREAIEEASKAQMMVETGMGDFEVVKIITGTDTRKMRKEETKDTIKKSLKIMTKGIGVAIKEVIEAAIKVIEVIEAAIKVTEVIEVIEAAIKVTEVVIKGEIKVVMRMIEEEEITETERTGILTEKIKERKKDKKRKLKKRLSPEVRSVGQKCQYIFMQ